MGQLNMQMTPAFEKALQRFMKVRGVKTKSEAIRIAVEDALASSTRRLQAANFHEWVGLGRSAPENPRPRFPDDRALWE